MTLLKHSEQTLVAVKPGIHITDGQVIVNLTAATALLPEARWAFCFHSVEPQSLYVGVRFEGSLMHSRSDAFTSAEQ